MRTCWASAAVAGIVVLLLLGGCPASLGTNDETDSQLDAAPADASGGDTEAEVEQPAEGQTDEADDETAADDDEPEDDPNSVLPRLRVPGDDQSGDGEPQDDLPDWPWESPNPASDPPSETDPNEDPPVTLPESGPPTVPVDDAVDETAEMIINLAAALYPYQSLSDNRFAPNPNTADEYGTCPTVRWAASLEWVLVGIDYGQTGCSSWATGGMQYAGNVGIMFERLTHQLWAEHCSFVMAGRAVTSHLEMYLTMRPDGVTVAGQIRVETNGVGSAIGDVMLDCDAAGWMEFSSGTLALANAENEYEATPINLAVDPLSNGNFVPDTGVLWFEVTDTEPPGDVLQVIVTYTAQSPVDGTVLVRVNGAEPYEYQIPGIGP